MEPFILSGPHIFSGPWIPIFEAVHGSLYSEGYLDLYMFDRSVDVFILAGLWIPIFQAVQGSLYSAWSLDPNIQSGPSTPIFLTGPWIPTTV